MQTNEKISAGGVVLRGNEVLTLYVPDHEEIVFPKGTIENNESSEEAAIREVQEETGYHVEILSPLDNHSYEFEEDGRHIRKTVHYYLMKLVDENEVPEPQFESHENFENKWIITNDAMDLLTHEANKALLKRAVELNSSLL